MKEFPSSKLNDFTHETLVRAVKAGLTRGLCAKSAGIAIETLFLWLRLGDQALADGEDTKYSRLAHDIRKAEADKAQELLKIIDSAAKSDAKHWTAAAWMLERRFKDDFSKREDINQHHSIGSDGMSADVINERIKQLFTSEKAKENDDPI